MNKRVIKGVKNIGEIHYIKKIHKEELSLTLVGQRSLLDINYVAAVKKSFVITIKSIIATAVLTLINLFI